MDAKMCLTGAIEASHMKDKTSNNNQLKDMCEAHPIDYEALIFGMLKHPKTCLAS